MISKSWLSGLLTVVVLACGCAEQTKTTKIVDKPAKVERNIVKLETSVGDMVIELNAEAAPITVKNFLGYVQEGFYDGTIFHRVIHGFMIQGGGFTTERVQKQPHDAITNEASNGLRNERGTVAMARSNDPHSATSQFFVNHVDNPPLNYVANVEPGYTVFGKVIEGMSVVDTMGRVSTTTRDGTSKKGQPMKLASIPVEPILLKSARVVSP